MKTPTCGKCDILVRGKTAALNSSILFLLLS